MESIIIKNCSEMTDKEFQIMKRDADVLDFTPYAKFSIALKGYDLYLKGLKVDKFEVWNSGYRNPDEIINGDKFVVIKKRWNNESKAWLPI